MIDFHMHDDDPNPSSARPALSRVEVLAHQLQEVLDRLKANAEHLSGDVFHHDTLFMGPDRIRLDERLEELIAELRFLSLGLDE